jgi:4-amino-4-deoxy-L-arabinose transferase-like glycosyltransferase
MIHIKKKSFTCSLPLLHILITAIVLGVFCWITKRYKPEPISDFSSYWQFAGDISSYVKGGLLFILYAPFRALNLEPYTSALIVNSFCFLGISYILWIGGKKGYQILSTFVLILIGIWFSGYAPIVNSDIPTITFTLLGLRIFSEALRYQRNIYIFPAIVFTVIGFTMRSQFLYSSIFISVFILIYFIFTKEKTSSLRKTLFFIILSTILAFSINSILINQSKEQFNIERHKRVPFYTGLIETVEQDSCGRYNIKAVELAEEEIEQPFLTLLIKKYKEIPIESYFNIISCKWKHYLFEHNQSGVGWLRAHLIKADKTDTINIFYFYVWDYIEEISVRLLKFVSAFLYIFFIIKIKQKNKTEIAVFIYLSFMLLFFFGVHTIMEIQPRYLISPVILATVILLYLHSNMVKFNKD